MAEIDCSTPFKSDQNECDFENSHSSIENPTLRCGYCNEIFKSKSDLRQHLVTNHAENKNVQDEKKIFVHVFFTLPYYYKAR